jgi:hypothetical protein
MIVNVILTVVNPHLAAIGFLEFFLTLSLCA